MSRLNLLRTGIALAAVLLLAAPPALATSASACSEEWEDSRASDTCKEPSFAFGDYGNGNNQCLQCCSIFAKCHTGNNFSSNPYHLDGIAVPLDDVDDLNNCSGYLQVGSC